MPELFDQSFLSKRQTLMLGLGSLTTFAALNAPKMLIKILNQFII